jgi:hypothetical protein
MALTAQRRGVRLGQHGNGDYLYEVSKGLHDPVTGVATIGQLPDPEIIFEEHGTGETCEYFELHRDAELNPELGPTESQPELAKRVNDADMRVKWAAINGAFAVERADNVNVMIAQLRTELEKTGGGVWIVRATHRLQRRMAMIRVLQAAHAQPDRPLQELVTEPHPLENHTAGGDIIGKHFYDPIILLPSPYALGTVGVRPVKEASETYLLICAFGPDQGMLLEDGEVEWGTLFETPGAPPYQKSGAAEYSWIKKLNGPGAQIETQLLLEWWTNSLNALLTEVTDLGRYRLDDGLLDARNAYRELRTLDRIFLNCIRIQTRPREHPTRVAAAFEFFDLLPNILDRPVTPREVWRALLNPDRARSILNASFAAAPEPIAKHLATRTDAALDCLRAETLDAVVPGRNVDDGVLVGDKNEAAVSDDEYVARLYHALRNTHHGYQLLAREQRDILDSSSGHISVAFPELVVLYVLALTADPVRALSGDWLGT